MKKKNKKKYKQEDNLELPNEFKRIKLSRVDQVREQREQELLEEYYGNERTI